MAIFGLFIILVGVVVGLTTFLGLGYDSDGNRDREVAIFSNNTTPELIFALGMITAALLLIGLWFMKYGAQRSWARRKEHKRIEELSDKLAAHEQRESDEGEK